MFNVKAEVKGDELIIRAKLTEERGVSRSGKTVIVASTEGNADLPGKPKGWGFGLNVWKPKP